MPDLQTATTHPARRNSLWLVAIAIGLMVLFFSYYHHASTHLRLGAGPDYASHNDITRFIQEHARLPRLPADEADLYFSAYGGTRALRPPLTYIVSAGLAERNPPTRDERLRSFRNGSNVLGALTVAVAFGAVVLWTNSILFGLLGAVLFGLWPQFSFIATYNNDDIGAIFSATFLVFALLRLWRCGHTLSNRLLLGVAGGLVILSKPSAWLLLPFVAAFMIGIMITQGWIKTLKTAGVAFVVAALVGGWWLAFNATHYGLDDIFQQKITQQIAAKHTRFDADQTFGYAARGINAKQLIVNNHDGFMLKTWIAVIGNLDWLRLRLGRIHYLWFSAILLLAALGPILLTYLRARGSPVQVTGQHHGDITDTPFMHGQNWWIGWLLIATILFQCAMYVYVNLYNDIQIQGKYLLTVLLPVILLACSAIIVLSTLLTRAHDSRWYASTIKPLLKARITVPLLILIGTAAFHYDALTRYVLPFYRPAIYQPPFQKLHMRTVKRVALTPDIFSEHNGIADMQWQEATGELKLTLEGNDPWLEFKQDICEPARADQPIRGNIMARIEIHTDMKDRFVIYWDEGPGFNEHPHKSQTPFHSQSDTVFVWMGMQACHRLRIDPSRHGGTMTLKSFELIDVIVDPEFDPPFGR